MKKIKLLSMLFVALTFVSGFVSCDSDPDSVELDYTKVIPGHWANTASADDVLETLSINYKGAGTIAYCDLVDQDWGVMAYGTYILSGGMLTATYTDVTVYDSNYEHSTYHGFTHGKTKTVKSTIVSCDGKKLMLKDENGKTHTYEKYQEVK